MVGLSVSVTPEYIVLQFMADGRLRMDANGDVWWLRKKVGGSQGPRLVDVEPRRADRMTPNGRRQMQVYVDGKRFCCSVSRVMWVAYHGGIPDGYHIHHIDKNRSNDSIENLECVNGSEHISSHLRKRSAWNKGTKYGETDAFKLGLANRKRNHARLCAEVYGKWRDGTTQASLADEYGVSPRQICDRLRSHRADNNLPNGRGPNNQAKD